MQLHWLVKSEPFKYAFEQLKADKKTIWDGVRNYQARNNLKAMQVGDLVLFYHSNEGKEIVGITKVTKTFFQDPTSTDPNWVSVELAYVKKLKNTVTLEAIKKQASLAEIGLVKQGRLSVMSIRPEEFDIILKMGGEL